MRLNKHFVGIAAATVSGAGIYATAMSSSRKPPSFKTLHTQSEFTRNDASLLFTPSVGQMYSISLMPNKENKPITIDTQDNIKYLITHYIDWKVKPRINIGSIPESVLDWIKDIWKVNSNNDCQIEDECFKFEIRRSDYDKISFPQKPQNLQHIKFKQLSLNDLDDILELTGYPQWNRNRYIHSAVNKKLASIGAFDSSNDDKLVGVAAINFYDLCIGGLNVKEGYRRKGIATYLMKLIIYQHLHNNGYDYIHSNVEIDNDISIKLHKKVGFKQLPDKYYWITDENHSE